MEVEGKRAVVFVCVCGRLYRGARGRSGVLRPDRYLRPGLLRGASVAQTRACDGRGLGLFLTTMASNEDDEVPRLWKVNRTIHELVKDRVREGLIIRRDNVAYTLCRASKSRTMKST